MLIYKVEFETPASPGISRIPPKRYCFDHGIRQVFGPVSLRIPEIFEERGRMNATYLGGIFENAVLNELKPHETQKTVAWRKAVNGSEVDFLFTRSQRTIPIEVKSTTKINRRHFTSLLEYLDFSGKKEGLLISGGKGSVHSQKGKTITQVPFYAISQGIRNVSR